MTESVVETTRTQVNVEEVTETRYRCCVCDMVYDGDEVLRVGVDRQAKPGELFTEGAQPRAERTICHHCADGLFDYTADSEDVFDDSETPANVDWVGKTAAYGSILTALALVTALVTLPVALAGGAAATIPTAVAAAVAAFVVRGWLT